VKFPKLERKRIYAAAPGSVEVKWPEGEPEVAHHYAVEKAEARKHEASDTHIIVLARRESKQGWHATVRIEDDPVRLLGKAGGYVDNPAGAIGSSDRKDQGDLRDEPEAVGKTDQERITKASGEAEVMRLRQHWAEKRARIQEAIADLREAGLDDRELWIMERRMEKLDAKLNADEEAA
jgi:hypothetical protein